MTKKKEIVKELKGEISYLRSIIDAYENLTVLREKEIEDARSTIDAFEKISGLRDKEIVDSKSTVEAYEKVSTLSKKEIEEARLTIMALEKTLGFSNREIGEAKSTINAFEKMSDLQLKEISEAKSTIDAYEKISEYTRKEYIDLVERVGKVRKFSHPIQKKMVRILDEDHKNESHILMKLNLLKVEDDSPNFYSHLFYVLTNLKFDEQTAREYWEDIIQLNDESSKKLGRHISFRVSLLDYFVGKNKHLRNPKIIEFKFYESVMEIEGDLEVARLIQEKLFPKKMPSVPGYNFYARYISMDKVGGDFYDVKESGDLIKIFMSDVSGHGLVSSYLAQIAKISLDSVPEKMSPREALTLINESICKYTVNFNYITSYLVEINFKKNTVRYSNAGHVPPVLYRAKSDEFFELKVKGQPLGWFEELDLEEGEMDLQPGDRLVIYTDGITECCNPEDVMFGMDSFKEFIRSNKDLSPEDLSSEIIKHLMCYSSRDSFNDDIAYVIVDVL
ncbi:SpoIIE family protein phosphatase [Spirochaetota bacterium]